MSPVTTTEVNNASATDAVPSPNASEDNDSEVPGTIPPPLPPLDQSNRSQSSSSPSSSSSYSSEVNYGLFGEHTGESDYAASEFSLSQRVMHFLGEKIDQQKNRFNVEICILIEAGTAVSNEKTTTAEAQNRMMKEKYVSIIRSFDAEDFITNDTQEDMCVHLFHGKRGGYTGEKLWRKFEECRRDIRNKYTPKLPRSISSYPSGHSLRDVYKQFALECYTAEFDVSLC